MSNIAEIFRLFFFAGWRRQVLILVAMLLGVAAENLSIASLWPLIELTGGGAATASPAGQLVAQVLASIGLSPTLGSVLLFLCATITLKFLLSSAGLIYVGKEVARMATQLRIRLIGAIVKARWSHIVDTPAGRLSAALGDEGERASAAYRSSGLFAVKLTETLTYLAGCLWVSWQFSVGAVVVAGILWLAVSRYVRMARRAGRTKWKSTHRLSGTVVELLTSIKSLRAMNRQAYLGTMAEEHSSRIRQSVEREYYSESAVKVVQDPLLGTMVVAGIYVGYTYFGLGLVELLGTVWLLRRISAGVTAMRGAMQRVALDGVAFWSVINLTESMERQSEALHGGKPAHLAQSCRFDNVRFSYGERVVVENASFDLPVGEVATLIGPSGAGKTTIADLLVGLNEPDSGRILVDGTPLSDIDLSLWRSKIGYIPQENILFNDSVRENVTLGEPGLSDEQVIAALKLAGAWGFVSALPHGLDEVIGVRGNRLSGGQKQRLSIARALIHEPELLILDEATSALDQATAREICEAVRGLRGNRTILAITHQSIWLEAADRVLTMQGGRVETTAPKA
ncbi:MAG: ABC transporter ATP-binding protein [Rhodospirillaceae bacterium]|nr:ABC transporter ATP-binding protein [Rhodospirillaceae bacterium]